MKLVILATIGVWFQYLIEKNFPIKDNQLLACLLYPSFPTSKKKKKNIKFWIQTASYNMKESCMLKLNMLIYILFILIEII